MKLCTRADYRKRRHYRVRRKVKGTAQRPRMVVSMSNLHMYVQFVDDEAARTLVAISTQSKDMSSLKGKRDLAAAKELGGKAAALASGKGIGEVVFDRGGLSYKGRVKAIADAARAGGLKL